VEYWDAVKSVTSVIKGGIEAIKLITTYTAKGSLAEGITAFRVDIKQIAEELARAFTEEEGGPSWPVIEDAAIAYWESVGKIIAIISPGIASIKALKEFGGINDLQQKVDAFILGMQSMVAGLLGAMSGVGMPSLSEADIAGEYFTAIVKIVSAVTPISEAINRIIGGSVVSLDLLRTQFPKFQANAEYIVQAMVAMVSTLESAGVEKATLFGEYMSDVADAIEDGLTAFNNVRNRAGGGDAHSAMDILWDFVRDVAKALQAANNNVREGLYNIESSFTQRLGAAYLAGYNYGAALAIGVNDGFNNNLGPLSVELPPLGAGAAPQTNITQNNQFAFSYQGAGAGETDMQRFSDFVIQRVQKELAR